MPKPFPPGFTAHAQSEALAMGFHLAKLTHAQAFTEPHTQQLQTWLQGGYHGGMAWMQEHAELRLTPQGLMPNAQSALVVALNYYPTQAMPPHARYKVARYAWGRDYHKLMRRRLAKLLKRLQQHYPTLQGRAVVDSAPLLEKALAVRAGLGWQGKNTLLITPQYGSWVFLGTLLLNAPWEEEAVAAPPPMPHCGTCTRCLEACPTQALIAPTLLDATRCLAYWNIEAPEEALVPQAMTQRAEGWVFGCDICQEVCPWNVRFAQPTTEPSLQEPHPMLAPVFDAEALLALPNTPQGDTIFDEQFAGYAVRRRGRRALAQWLRQINEVAATNCK
jgi:epoxyqueuosine reductase